MSNAEPLDEFSEWDRLRPGRRQALARIIGNAAASAEGAGEALTIPERNVLIGLADGLSLAEIRATIAPDAFSPRSVKRVYLAPMRKKVGARNNNHLVRIGVEDEVIPLTMSANGRKLAGQQKEVLDLLSFGASKIEIAGFMGISPITVSVHCRRAAANLQAINEPHAIKLAFERGELTPAEQILN